MSRWFPQGKAYTLTHHPRVLHRQYLAGRYAAGVVPVTTWPLYVVALGIWAAAFAVAGG